MKSDKWFEELLQASQGMLEHLQALQERIQARLEIMRELTKQNNALRDSCNCATSSHCYCHGSSHRVHRQGLSRYKS